MVLRNLFFLFALAAITGGCWYQPDEEYENPIEPVTADKFNINLDDINNADTIKILGPATFNYSLSGSTSGGTKVKVTLGTRQLAASSTNGTFEIREGDLTTGVYDLKVEITTGSGSGSVADVRGDEKIVITEQWIVMIFVDRPAFPQITSSVVNGYNLTWLKGYMIREVSQTFTFNNEKIAADWNGFRLEAGLSLFLGKRRVIVD